MTEHVSEQILESLLSEMTAYAVRSCSGNRSSIAAPKISAAAAASAAATSTTSEAAASVVDTATSEDLSYFDHHHAGGATAGSGGSGGGGEDEQEKTVSAEMAAAKLERMGYAVGYRITERLAQHKTWNSLLTQDAAAQTAAQQLEAVKFLCKEVWVQTFGKQIDKLQTNHRGVFVLKDLDLKWLSCFPSGTEESRCKAMQLLAFPCGLIRGCLADLGIPAVVSCDFLVDGQNMSACSFNIKIK